MAKAKAEKDWRGLTMITDGSRRDDGAAGYAWCGSGDSPGRVSERTWATTKTNMTQNEPPSQGNWKQLQEERLRRCESKSSQMLKPPSEGWHRTSLAPDSSMLSRQESTLLHYGAQGPPLPSRLDGVCRTKGWKGIRRWTSGRKSRWRSQTAARWNG